MAITIREIFFASFSALTIGLCCVILSAAVFAAAATATTTTAFTAAIALCTFISLIGLGAGCFVSDIFW